MGEIKIGERVKVRGETQSYLLTDPTKIHHGTVVGKEGGQLLVKLDKPVMRGSIEFGEVTVPEASVSLSTSRADDSD